MRTKILVICLLLFVSCSGYRGDYQAREKYYRMRKIVVFPEYSKEEVWQASIDSLVDRWDCTITVSDMNAGLIQAHEITGVITGFVLKWTIQVLESKEGVNLNVHLERDMMFLSRGASQNVEDFIKAVRERLEDNQ